MTDRFGTPSGGFSVSAVPGSTNLPLDWEQPTQWSQLEKYLEPAFRENTKKIISLLTENSKSLEDFLQGTVYKINGGTLYGDVSITGSLTVDGSAFSPMPPGAIMQYAGSTAPLGWLICDGTAYQQTSYANLYASISSTYNTHCGASAPASGYFRVPNYQGRILVGRNPSDSTFDSLTDYGGEKEHTLTIGEMPSHNHSMGNNVQGTVGLHDHVLSGTDMSMAPDTGITVFNLSTGYSGSGSAHNNLQPYAVVNYIIKY